MIGQTITSRPRVQWGLLFWLLLAVALDVAAIVNNSTKCALFSVQPWFVVLILWFMRPRHFEARFTDTAVEVDEPPQVVPYADLQGLLASRRPLNPFKAGPRSYSMQVLHTGGILRIPDRLDVPSDDVFSFLFGRFSPGGSRDVPEVLTDYLRRKEQLYGPQHVWTYCARVHLGSPNPLSQLMAFFLALLLAGLFWTAWGAVRGNTEWLAGGLSTMILAAFLTSLVWILSRSQYALPVAAPRQWRQAGLVISPDGLALAQGTMVGQLRWDELRDVKLLSAPSLTNNQRGGPAILLKVEGASLTIADVYDRPLGLIYQNIRHYRRAVEDADDRERTAARPRREHVHPAADDASASERITPAE